MIKIKIQSEKLVIETLNNTKYRNLKKNLLDSIFIFHNIYLHNKKLFSLSLKNLGHLSKYIFTKRIHKCNK